MQNDQSPSQLLKQGLWQENPVFRHTLGICSTLAVTNLVVNTLVMSAGIIFTLSMSCVTVSLLRHITPMRTRMMAQTLIISSYVIVFDILIQAYLPDISEALGPYVGLIITNCIIMGRCEAFARENPVFPSLLDGFAVGIGFSLVLLAIAVVRELLGFGTLLGFTVMPDGFTPWTIMVMAPGAFFTLGIYVWLVRSFSMQFDKK
ncbi:MAG: NADH:ubiquinone reductase (Na(+)-transporting) subunit D [Desulfobulbaceae bacterium]|nr:NADH:ubiquinone reductase (Na(+)-transporting) subunit D [Desulfobulbaceae bacterium]